MCNGCTRHGKITFCWGLLYSYHNKSNVCSVGTRIRGNVFCGITFPENVYDITRTFPTCYVYVGSYLTKKVK